MKHTQRNNKKKLQKIQSNKRKTRKYYYNCKDRVTKIKHNKKVGGRDGGYSFESGVNVEPSAFFKLIKKYNPGTSIMDIKQKLLDYNLNLYNIIFKSNEEINPSYYGNKTEELIANIASGAYDNVDRYDSKNYSIKTDYKGKTNQT